MRLLVLYHAGFSYAEPIFHYLSAFHRHSRHEVEFFNVDQQYDAPPDFSGYDALLLNFCAVSVVRFDHPPPFVPPLIAGLQRYSGLKIAAVQDEYDFTNRVKAFLLAIGADVILTNVPQGGMRRVYGEPEFERVRFETVQTAYLADEVLSAEVLPLADRPLPLGYRGRELPFRLGDLGWHKAEVGYRFMSACIWRNVGFDIAVDEGARFHGEAWLRFVRNCRVMLGTQSGSNVFDFDGSLDRLLLDLHPQGDFDLRYEDVRDAISAHEVGFDMGQVSARIFEAVGSRTALALVRGSYSGVIEPEAHYVPIEPDYSNIDQVLDRIQDVPAMQAMVDRAYEHVVGNPANHYAGMVARVDAIIDEMATLSPVRAARLPVTAAPLGNDPYLFQRIMKLRDALQIQEVA